MADNKLRVALEAGGGAFSYGMPAPERRSGWLEKRGGVRSGGRGLAHLLTRGALTRRFFVLSEGTLSYSKDETSPPLNTLQLGVGASVELDDPAGGGGGASAAGESALELRITAGAGYRRGTGTGTGTGTGADGGAPAAAAPSAAAPAASLAASEGALGLRADGSRIELRVRFASVAERDAWLVAIQSHCGARAAAPLGISLAGLEALIARAGGREACKDMTMEAFKVAAVLPATAATRSSYTDLLARSSRAAERRCVAAADVFLSHAYSYRFIEVCDALEAWVFRTSPAAGDNGHFFYIDFLVVNQHAQKGVVPFHVLRSEFGGSVAAIGRTLFFLDFDKPDSLTRAWCIYEVLTTILVGASFAVIMSPANDIRNLEALRYATPSRNEVEALFATVCVEAASAREATDLAHIRRAIEESVGYERCNAVVRGALRAWALRTAWTALLRRGEGDADGFSAGLCGGIDSILAAHAAALAARGEVAAALALFDEDVETRRRALGEGDALVVEAERNRARARSCGWEGSGAAPAGAAVAGGDPSISPAFRPVVSPAAAATMPAAPFFFFLESARHATAASRRGGGRGSGGGGGGGRGGGGGAGARARAPPAPALAALEPPLVVGALLESLSSLARETGTGGANSERLPSPPLAAASAGGAALDAVVGLLSAASAAASGAAASVIEDLAAVGEFGATACIAAGAAPALVAALATETFRAGAGAALGRALECLAVSSCEAVVAAGAAPAIIAALAANASGEAATCAALCDALGRMMSSGGVAEAAATGVVPAALEVLSANARSSERSAIAACTAASAVLCSIASLGAGRAALFAAGAAPALVTALVERSPGLDGAAAAALGSVLLRIASEDDGAAAVAALLVAALHAVIGERLSAVRLIGITLCRLARMSRGRDALIAAGALPAVLAGLLKYPDSDAVTMPLSAALACIADGDARDGWSIVVPALINEMFAHEGDEARASVFAGVLGRIADGDADRAVAAAALVGALSSASCEPVAVALSAALRRTVARAGRAELLAAGAVSALDGALAASAGRSERACEALRAALRSIDPPVSAPPARVSRNGAGALMALGAGGCEAVSYCGRRIIGAGGGGAFVCGPNDGPQCSDCAAATAVANAPAAPAAIASAAAASESSASPAAGASAADNPFLLPSTEEIPALAGASASVSPAAAPASSSDSADPPPSSSAASFSSAPAASAAAVVSAAEEEALGLVAALRSAGTDATALRTALAALDAQLRRGQSAATALVAASAIPALTSALTVDHASLCASLCATIGRVFYSAGSASAGGVLSALTAALSEHAGRAIVCLPLCTAIFNVTSRDAEAAALLAAAAAPALVAVLTANVGDAATCVEASGALVRITAAGGVRGTAALIEALPGPPLVAALTAHAGRAEASAALRAALRCLGEAAREALASCWSAVVVAVATPALVAALVASAADAEASAALSAALIAIAASDDGAARSTVISALAALRRRPPLVKSGESHAGACGYIRPIIGADAWATEMLMAAPGSSAACAAARGRGRGGRGGRGGGHGGGCGGGRGAAAALECAAAGGKCRRDADDDGYGSGGSSSSSRDSFSDIDWPDTDSDVDGMFPTRCARSALSRSSLMLPPRVRARK